MLAAVCDQAVPCIDPVTYQRAAYQLHLDRALLRLREPRAVQRIPLRLRLHLHPSRRIRLFRSMKKTAAPRLKSQPPVQPLHRHRPLQADTSVQHIHQRMHQVRQQPMPCLWNPPELRRRQR